MKGSGAFKARQFVDQLINEGDSVICDGISDTNFELPEYYDYEKYNRGQKYFHDNIFGMFFAKFLGLLLTLAPPKGNAVLRCTNMSSTPLKSYKRYMSTIFHMNVWYTNKLDANSRTFKSLKTVKSMHFAASLKSESHAIGKITQKDMALGQFGFMGLVLACPEKVGLHNTQNQDLDGFVHLWRVIGYMLGMDDKFNLCRDNTEDTIEICKLLLKTEFKSYVQKMDDGFLVLARNLTESMWCMNPALEINWNLYYLLNIMGLDYRDFQKDKIDLSFKSKILLWLIILHMYLLRFRIVKMYLNFVQRSTLKIMYYFPFLAYYKFGYKNAYLKEFSL